MLRPLAAALVSLLITSAAAAAPPPAAPQGILPRDALPAHYSLTLTIDPTAATFRGHDEIQVIFTRKLNAIWIHGKNLTVISASVRLADGRTLPAQYREVDPSGVARLSFAGTVPQGRATLLFEYKAPFGTALAGLYRMRHNGLDYAVTQFESIDARRMFPSFDEPGFKTPFSIAVNAPKGDVVVANSKVVSKNQTGNGNVHWVFAETKKLPAYLVALAVGPFDVVDAGAVPPDAYRKTPLVIRGIAPKGEGKQMRYALSFTPRLVSTLENYFRIGYPFDKLDMIAVPDFAAGAMENAGAITFRERYLLFTPHSPLEQRRASISVQAHELTHQWFGDLVTPRWWDDTWLNESFAAWMAPKAAGMVAPALEFGRQTLSSSLAVMRTDELASARRIRNPVLNAGDIENAFDGITYDKGAGVLAMYEAYAGDDAWRAALHAYLTRYAGGNASAKEFIASVAGSTQHPEIAASFLAFLDQPGVPEMTVATRCSDNPALTVVQQMYAPIGRMVPDRQWPVPMCIAAPGLGPACRIAGRTADIPLGATCPAYVMPNAGGKGYYRFAYDPKGWEQMIKAAPDLDPADQLTLFANLDAAMAADQLAPAKLFEAIKALAPVAKWDLIEMIDASLRALRAHVLRGEDLAVYRGFVHEAFAKRLAMMGLKARADDTPETAFTRAALVHILVEEAREPQTLSELSKAAQAYAASQGRNLDGISPDLAQEAMRAGVIVNGTAFAKTLMDGYAASNDDYFHRSVLYAVMGSQDPAFLSRVFDLALSPAMHIGDIRYLYLYAAPEPVARTALWKWLRIHYDALARRVSPNEIRRAVSLFDDTCTPELRKEVDGYFAPKAAQIQALRRPLALTEERIDRCIAFHDAKAKDIRAALIVAAKAP